MVVHHTQPLLGSPTHPGHSRRRAVLMLARVLRCWRLGAQQKVGAKVVGSSHDCQKDHWNMVQPNVAQRHRREMYQVCQATALRSAAHQNCAHQDKSPETDCRDSRAGRHDSETMVGQADTVEASPFRLQAHREELAMCHLPAPDLEIADCLHLPAESCLDGLHDHPLTRQCVAHRLMKSMAAATQHALAKKFGPH